MPDRLTTQPLPSDPIDAVITWVNGTDPSHRALRAGFMARAKEPLNENARNPHRWEASDEIYFCLRAIHRFAPWMRHIWIVTEAAGPDLSQLPEALRAKIRIIQHDLIFEGAVDALPTFNSLAIETAMWRIEGLAERFVYFNDDVFLTAPLSPEDVFEGGAPVLRGAWVDYSALLTDPDARDDPALFHRFVQINAAALCGFKAARLFAPAHVVHPMRRSVMAQLAATHRAAFAANLAYRFRDLRQFLPQGAHAHACIAARNAVFVEARDHLHITSGQGSNQPPEQTRDLLMPAALAGIKFLCVNDLPQLEALVPDARRLIAAAIGDE